MSLQPVSKRYNPGLAGLVTEGNGLAVVENSTQAESNYEIMRDGTRRRRRPIIEELPQGPLSPGTLVTPATTVATSSFMWEDISGRPDLSVLVTQVGFQITLHLQSSAVAAPVEADHVNLIDLRFVSTNNRDQDATLSYEGELSSEECTYAQGNGYLYIFNSISGTVKVKWTGSSGATWKIYGIERMIRDFEGIDISEADYSYLWDDTRVEEKTYNRLNAGWRKPTLEAYSSLTAVTFDLPGPSVKKQTGRSVDDTGVYSFKAQNCLDEATAEASPHSAPIGSLVEVTGSHSKGGNFTKIRDFTSLFTAAVVYLGGLDYLELTWAGSATGADGFTPVDEQEVMFNSLRYTITDGTNTHVGAFSGHLRQSSIGDTFYRKLARLPTGSWTVDIHEITIAYQQYPFTMHANGDPAKPFHGRSLKSYASLAGAKPAAGALYVGRLWQTADDYNRVYFSAVLGGRNNSDIEDSPKETICFQANDPTDADVNAVLGDDGGFLVVEGIGAVVGCEVLGNQLIILADNGVWAIGPGSSGLFTPDDFSVAQISTSGASSKKGILLVQDTLMYMSHQGMLAISPSAETRALSIRDMSSGAIRTLIDSLSYASKRACSIAFDSSLGVVRWVFPVGVVNEVISLSVANNAFYIYDTISEGHTIKDIITLPEKQVISGENRFRYLISTNVAGVPTTYNWGVEASFSDIGEPANVEYNGTNVFADFRDTGNNDTAAPAFMHTHPIIFADGNRFQQINYVHVFNNRVDTHWIEEFDGSFTNNLEGSLMMEARWDWSDHIISGKQTNPAQTYKHRRPFLPDAAGERGDGEPVLVTKHKVRGRGRELSLYFTTSDNYDVSVLGWTIEGLVLQEL